MTATTTPPRTHRHHPPASARERVRGAGAALLLLALLAVVPLLLATFIGNPLPHHVPNVSDLHRSLVQPLSDNAVVRVLAVVAWAAWAHLLVAVVRELRAQLRGLPSPRQLPVFGFNQQLAHQLVATALLLIPAAASMHTTPVAALTRAAGDPYPSGPARPVAAVALATDTPGRPHDAEPAATATRDAPTLVTLSSQPPSTRPHKVYVVQPPHGRHYDSLWDIAVRHLRDGRRYREIYELNKGRPQPDGGELTRASLIQPGWVLLLPADATGAGVRDADSGATGQTAAKPTAAPPPVAPPSPRPAHSADTAHARQTDRQDAVVSGATGDRKSTVSEPTPTATRANRPDAVEHGAPIVPIAIGLGLGSLAALAALQRARRSALRRRPIGHRIAPTPSRLQQVEAGLRAEARHADPLGATVRLAVVLARQRGSDATVQQVSHHDDGSVTLRFADPAPPAPPPFTATEAGWHLPAVATGFAFAVDGNQDPLPALLQLGRDHDAEVYVDLERAGYTAVGGEAIAVDDLLASAAARLVGAPWATRLRLVIPARLAGRVGALDRVEAVDDLAVHADGLLGELATSRTRLPDSGPDKVVGEDSSAPCHPVVCLIGWRCDELPDELAGAALDPASPILAVTAGEDTRAQRQWQLHGDQLTGAGAAPVTIATRPSAADQVAELIEHTCTAPSVPADDPALDALRTESPPAAPTAPTAMTVNVLGPVELHGIDEPTPRRTPIFRTLVYLALHRRGVNAEQLATALWPDELAAGRTVRNRIAEARALVDGAITNGPGWQLEERVGCDWQQFQALAAGSPAEQIAALDLVRGQPFDGFADEWVDVEMLRSDMIAAIIDLTVAVAERALLDGDPTLAFRAARTGLRASPYEERLFRLAMQAADAEGSTGKLRALMDELQRVLDVHVAPDDRMQRETVALYQELTSVARRKERVH